MDGIIQDMNTIIDKLEKLVGELVQENQKLREEKADLLKRLIGEDQ